MRCKKGQFTDDTGLMLCMADSLLIHKHKINNQDLRHRFHHWWYSSYNNGKKNDKDEKGWRSFGIGRALRASIKSFVKDNQSGRVEGCDGTGTDNGNGSVMRVAAIPVAFRNDLEGCLNYAKEQSYCTHNGEEASECCRLLCYVGWHLLNLQTPKECKEFLDKLGEKFKSDNHGVQRMAESKAEDESNLEKVDKELNESLEDRNWNWRVKDYRYSPKRT